MKALRKRLLVAATVASLGLTTAVFAGSWGEHGPMGGGDCPMRGGHHEWGSGQGDAMLRQHHAERMELLAARLKLNPSQEAAWKSFIAAQDAHHATLLKLWREMRERESSVMAHFEQRVRSMEQRLASMKSVAKAAGDLYAALDPQQKQVMDKFFADHPMRRGLGRGPDAMPDPMEGGPAAPAADK